MTVLGNSRLSRQDWLAKMKVAAKEKEKLIRHAYFVEKKSIGQIKREFHTHWVTVHKAIQQGKGETH